MLSKMPEATKGSDFKRRLSLIATKKRKRESMLIARRSSFINMTQTSKLLRRQFRTYLKSNEPEYVNTMQRVHEILVLKD